MRKMGKYCKAYPINRFREFAHWKENGANTRKESQIIDGEEVETNRQLTDNDFLYLQEDFTVTDGIFLGENTIFNEITPEWKDYCKNVLKFEIPIYDVAQTDVSGT